MHSYGGLVGSNAIPQDFDFTHIKEKGLKGGVIHLLLVTAFLIEEGKSILDAFGSSLNDDIQVALSFMNIHFERLSLTGLARQTCIHQNRRSESLQ